jgi:hypothetical protein
MAIGAEEVEVKKTEEEQTTNEEGSKAKGDATAGSADRYVADAEAGVRSEKSHAAQVEREQKDIPDSIYKSAALRACLIMVCIVLVVVITFIAARQMQLGVVYERWTLTGARLGDEWRTLFETEALALATPVVANPAAPWYAPTVTMVTNRLGSLRIVGTYDYEIANNATPSNPPTATHYALAEQGRWMLGNTSVATNLPIPTNAELADPAFLTTPFGQGLARIGIFETIRDPDNVAYREVLADQLMPLVHDHMKNYFATHHDAHFKEAESAPATSYGTDVYSSYGAGQIHEWDLIRLREWKNRTFDGSPTGLVLYEFCWALGMLGAMFSLSYISAYVSKDRDVFRNMFYPLLVVFGIILIVTLRIIENVVTADKKAYWTSDGYANWKEKECGELYDLPLDSVPDAQQMLMRGGQTMDWWMDEPNTYASVQYLNWAQNNSSFFQWMHFFTLIILFVVPTLLPMVIYFKPFMERAKTQLPFFCVQMLIFTFFLVYFIMNTFEDGDLYESSATLTCVGVAWLLACLFMVRSPDGTERFDVRGKQQKCAFSHHVMGLVLLFVLLPHMASKIYRMVPSEEDQESCLTNCLMHVVAIGFCARTIARVLAEQALNTCSLYDMDVCDLAETPILALEAFMIGMEINRVGDLGNWEVWVTIVLYLIYQFIRDSGAHKGRFREIIHGIQDKYADKGFAGGATTASRDQAFAGVSKKSAIASKVCLAVFMGGFITLSFTTVNNMFYAVDGIMENSIHAPSLNRAIEDTGNSIVGAVRILYNNAAVNFDFPMHYFAAYWNICDTNHPTTGANLDLDKYNFPKSYKLSFRETLRNFYVRGETAKWRNHERVVTGILFFAFQLVIAGAILVAKKKFDNRESLLFTKIEMKNMVKFAPYFAATITYFIVYTVWLSFTRVENKEEIGNAIICAWEKTDNARLTYASWGTTANPDMCPVSIPAGFEP